MLQKSPVTLAGLVITCLSLSAILSTAAAIAQTTSPTISQATPGKLEPVRLMQMGRLHAGR